MYNRILLALRDSEHSQETFESALSLAQASDARLMILHTFPSEEAIEEHLTGPVQAQLSRTSAPGFVAEPSSATVAHDLDILHSLYKTAKSVGVTVDLAQAIGDPKQTICEQAWRWGADLILLGQRDLDELDTPITEEICNYVVHHAPCQTQRIDSL